MPMLTAMRMLAAVVCVAIAGTAKATDSGLAAPEFTAATRLLISVARQHAPALAAVTPFRTAPVQVDVDLVDLGARRVRRSNCGLMALYQFAGLDESANPTGKTPPGIAGFIRNGCDDESPQIPTEGTAVAMTCEDHQAPEPSWNLDAGGICAFYAIKAMQELASVGCDLNFGALLDEIHTAAPTVPVPSGVCFPVDFDDDDVECESHEDAASCATTGGVCQFVDFNSLYITNQLIRTTFGVSTGGRLSTKSGFCTKGNQKADAEYCIDKFTPDIFSFSSPDGPCSPKLHSGTAQVDAQCERIRSAVIANDCLNDLLETAQTVVSQMPSLFDGVLNPGLDIINGNFSCVQALCNVAIPQIRRHVPSPSSSSDDVVPTTVIAVVAACVVVLVAIALLLYSRRKSGSSRPGGLNERVVGLNGDGEIASVYRGANNNFDDRDDVTLLIPSPPVATTAQPQFDPITGELLN